MRKVALFFLLLFLNLFQYGVAAAAGGNADENKPLSSDTSLLSLERIFNTREFRTEHFGPARWLRRHTGYSTLESAGTDVHKNGGKKISGEHIVKYDPETGKREVLV
jgi:hypothetical protein